MNKPLGQYWIDFCESQMFICQNACGKRVNISWLWSWTFWQERTWHKISYWGLK